MKHHVHINVVSVTKQSRNSWREFPFLNAEEKVSQILFSFSEAVSTLTYQHSWSALPESTNNTSCWSTHYLDAVYLFFERVSVESENQCNPLVSTTGFFLNILPVRNLLINWVISAVAINLTAMLYNEVMTKISRRMKAGE